VKENPKIERNLVVLELPGEESYCVSLLDEEMVWLLNNQHSNSCPLQFGPVVKYYFVCLVFSFKAFNEKIKSGWRIIYGWVTGC
jgi:hypothetical protein